VTLTGYQLQTDVHQTRPKLLPKRPKLDAYSVSDKTDETVTSS